ncbi:MAG: NUDIX domain-containing protein [Fibrobacter sp.]|nr:NUDIX domain-containing protein [Fibrobacter sp.]
MEYFDVIESDGNFAGYSLSRDVVHSRGLWHRTVHVWVFNSHNELLIQKRSLTKEVYPGLWDISCAGHVSAGESNLTAAVRELHEELGLTVVKDDLSFLFTVTQKFVNSDKTFIDNELTDVFLLRKDLVIDQIQFDENEVIGLKFVPIQMLKDDLTLKSFLFAPHNEEYYKLFTALEPSV